MPDALPRTPSFRLDGRRAFITGAGKGIGLACAAALAEAGAEVTLAARTEADIEAGAIAIQAAGGRAHTMVLDICDLVAAKAAIADTGPFDILVSNAGTNRPMPMAQVTVADYDAVLDLNLRAAYFAAQAVALGLIEAGRPGSLIHISSQMGHVGGVNRSLYCASKWAVEGMSKSFALDLAHFGIRSNTIAPTFIETPMTKAFFEDEKYLAEVLARIKLGRLGKVEDLMGAVLFLASDASAMVTGTSIVIDGGWTAD